MKYIARELLALRTEDLWNLPDGPMDLVFDDGVLKTTTRKTIFSAYLWEFHRLYPNTPLLKERHHIGDRRLGADTHLRILGAGLFDAYDASGEKLDMGHLTRLAYEVTNKLYNDFTYKLEAYVTSLNILDFIEVMDHPAIFEANSNIKPYEASISHTHGEIERVLMDPAELKGNPISRIVKTDPKTIGQVMQCVGPRGTLTDIDSTIFRQPVLVGYAEGLRSLYDSMVESRSAAKALMYTKDPVAESEYFNRKMQLLAATVKRVRGLGPMRDPNTGALVKDPVKKDCGSKSYRTFKVRSGDLAALAGKYYLTEGGGLDTVKLTDRHLIGKNINMRSVFDCRINDREGVCATCFGDLSLSIPAFTNIGHQCSTKLCEMVSQAVLSTKHLDRSSSVDELPLSDFERKYIRLGSDPNAIGLSTRLAGKHIKLIVKGEEAKNLSDIVYAKAVTDLPVGRVTELSEVEIETTHKGQLDKAIIPISIGSRLSSFNHRMLEYIKQHGWELTETGDYIIDLKDWNHDDMIFELALKHINMVDFMKSIEHMIKAGIKGKAIKTLKDFDDPWSALLELYTLVSSKLTVNISHLEIIVLSTMIVSAKEYNYNIPLPGEEFEFGPYADNIAFRSMSAQFAFEKQMPALYDVKSYIVRDRPSHPLDAMVAD